MKLNFNSLEKQEGKLGRPFIYSSVERVPDTMKYFGKEQKSHWLHVFRYLDNGDFFAVVVDYAGNIIKVIKHYEFPRLPDRPIR